jgi:uncharacterized protein YyaL (SSP411 family)
VTNRLARATSPYLLQHADNPVAWQEWNAAAFTEARERDVPVLLSVGYAACHWCHVMAHESFEDAAVADAMNRGFVPVKVDREERPDLDAIYMQATTAMTGSGGWPMTCFLTPTGEPFFCGTYYPKPQLLQLLAAVDDAWTHRQDEVLASGARIAETLRQAVTPGKAVAIGPTELQLTEEQLAAGFDSRNGGFGRAPKFPPSMVLEFLLRHHARTGSSRALQMVESTCEAMARGGLYDQLAGGFARYSVDAGWVVPHFEKMLYDNALLLRVYLNLYRATGSGLAERVVRETAQFLLRELRTPEGGFASSLDADTEGVEGLTYAWSPAQLTDVLGEDDGRRAATLLEVTGNGTFERGLSTLQLRSDPQDPQWWTAVRDQLRRAREERPQPMTDDKVVTAWNGLAIAALSEAGALLEEYDWVRAAIECAELLLTTHLVDGRWRRSSRGRTVGRAAAVADDHGDLAEGLLALHQATFDARWLAAAGEVLDTALEHFRDGSGAFHDTADDAEELFIRPASQGDNAEPCGTSALAGALLTYSALTGSTRHRDAADAAITAGGAVASRDPRFAGWTLAVAEAAATGPLQVAISGTDDPAAEMLSLARLSGSPGLVLALGRPDEPGLPLLEGRPMVGDRGTAYVCRGFVCDAPVTEVEQLRLALARNA